jgi:hypothetical protein
MQTASKSPHEIPHLKYYGSTVIFFDNFFVRTITITAHHHFTVVISFINKLRLLNIWFVNPSTNS